MHNMEKTLNILDGSIVILIGVVTLGLYGALPTLF